MLAEFERLALEHGWDVSLYLRAEEGIWVATVPAPSVSYPESGHANLVDAEEQSFWYRSRAEAILEAVRRYGDGGCLWEVGAGNGHVAAALARDGHSVVAVEPGPVGAANAERRGVPTVQAVLADLDLPDRSLHAMGMFDVLEHLEHPQSILADVRRVLRREGVLVITVPAYPWLWSDKDVVAGHHRRYTRGGLDAELAEAGFTSLDSRYLFPLLVPPMVLRYRVPFLIRGSAAPEQLHARVSQDLKGRGGIVRSLVDGIFSAEGRLTRRLRVPFGTSVLGVYQKE